MKKPRKQIHRAKAFAYAVATIVTATAVTALLHVSSPGNDENRFLRYAIRMAGDNKSELKAVLHHYRTGDKDPEKLKSAEYLIANMPAHYSYADTSAINSYYRTALTILGTGPDPDWQRDTLRQISDCDYQSLSYNTISDVRIMTADYLIYSIDHAFEQWRTRPWAQHLTYTEFRDWLLPYKVTELQSFDDWRKTLSAHYSDSISTIPADDARRNSIYGAIEIVRSEIHSKQSDIGLRVIWEGHGGIPLRNAETWTRMTYGTCMDYVTMGTAVFRSLGLPAAVDQVPLWGRNNSGHSWYVFPSDNGIETPTMNSLIVGAGMGFYPYERIPKVWRETYAINRERFVYRTTSRYVYPFNLCQEDVTDHYCRTSDIKVTLRKDVRIKDRYVYIAMAANGGGPQWQVLDFGRVRHGKASFRKMGRDMLYIALRYDGRNLFPASSPFILNRDGTLEYVTFDDSATRSITLHRKYYESYNVVDQRRKILGAKIQCADRTDFSDAVSLHLIDTTAIPDRIPLDCDEPHRYWRYLAADGTYGSIAELAFFNDSTERLQGKPIACKWAQQSSIGNAFDNNRLSNFETDQPDGNWVGLDMGEPVCATSVRIVPRGDDNDICPGDEYELLYFDGDKWQSCGRKMADDNELHYDDIPSNCLLWLRDLTRGNDERPFLIDGKENTDWW